MVRRVTGEDRISSYGLRGRRSIEQRAWSKGHRAKWMEHRARVMEHGVRGQRLENIRIDSIPYFEILRFCSSIFPSMPYALCPMLFFTADGHRTRRVPSFSKPVFSRRSDRGLLAAGKLLIWRISIRLTGLKGEGIFK